MAAQQHQPPPGGLSRGAAAGETAGAHRAVARIRAELAEVERHLREVPPHHGGGAADLQARADALRRELAAAEEARARDVGAGRRAAQAAQAQQQ